MITKTFSVKNYSRVIELQQFVKTQGLKYVKFIGNPIRGIASGETGEANYFISIELNIIDNNTLNELFKQWYEFDNPIIPKKSFKNKVLDWFK